MSADQASHPETLFHEDGDQALILCDLYTRGQAIVAAIQELACCPRSMVGIYFRDYTASRRHARQRDDRHTTDEFPYGICDPSDEGAAAYWWVRRVEATGRAATRPASRIGLKVERRATNRVLERRCRAGRYWPAVRSVWAIPRRHVEAALQRELRRQRYAQTLRSRCLPVRLRRVYDRIPGWRQDAWQDIHVCEGSWADSGDPYWGGLQMDWDFMRAYGADALRWYGGAANRWPWYVQTVVADRAWRAGRGFYPWPDCARRAGLI